MKKETPHIPSQYLTERWILVDANNQVVGRFASLLAKLLMGKDQAQFNPATDSKTNVVVINAEKVRFTGKKMTDKEYHRHTGYPGGIKSITPINVLKGPDPTRIVTNAVNGMLPKNKLRSVMMRRLKVFVGAEHTHGGQNPVIFKI